MKIHNSMKLVAALPGSLAMVAAQADAKPGKGNKGDKGEKGKDAGHSQKDHGVNNGKKSQAADQNDIRSCQIALIVHRNAADEIRVD